MFKGEMGTHEMKKPPFLEWMESDAGKAVIREAKEKKLTKFLKAIEGKTVEEALQFAPGLSLRGLEMMLSPAEKKTVEEAKGKRKKEWREAIETIWSGDSLQAHHEYARDVLNERGLLSDVTDLSILEVVSAKLKAEGQEKN